MNEAPVLLLATYRADELHRRHPLRPFLADLDRLPQVTHVDVPRLDRTAVTELLDSLLAHPPDPNFVEEIFQRSDGIPFFVEELANTDCCDLPAGLRNVLIIRFEALSPDAQNTVRLVAVAGNRAEHVYIAAVSDLGRVEFDTAVREAIDGQLLVADNTGFRSGMHCFARPSLTTYCPVRPRACTGDSPRRSKPAATLIQPRERSSLRITGTAATR